MAKIKHKDPNGAHSRIYHSLHDTSAFRVLSGSSVKLFLDMRRSLTGTNNGNLSAALSDLKHRGWSSGKTLTKALYELRALGFIAVTREGGFGQGTRVCSLYRFTDLEVYEQPKVSVLHCKATHDYLQYKSVREAEQALSEGTAKLKNEGRKKQAPRKKSPASKRCLFGIEREPEAPFFGHRKETGRCSTSIEREQGKTG